MTESEVIELIKDRIRRAEVPVKHHFLVEEEDGHYILTKRGG